jgi:hypothetical protein
MNEIACTHVVFEWLDMIVNSFITHNQFHISYYSTMNIYGVYGLKNWNNGASKSLKKFTIYFLFYFFIEFMMTKLFPTYI